MPKNSFSVSPSTFERASKMNNISSHSKIQPVNQALQSCVVHVSTKPHCSMEWLYYYGKAYFKGNTDLLTIIIWYENVFPLSNILRDLFFLPVLGSFTTTSEISKSLRGKGIFLLAAIVFSSPGRRVVRATCRTNRETASQIASKIPRFLQFFCFVHS